MAKGKIKPDAQGYLASFKVKVQPWSLNSTFNMKIDCRFIYILICIYCRMFCTNDTQWKFNSLVALYLT